MLMKYFAPEEARRELPGHHHDLDFHQPCRILPCYSEPNVTKNIKNKQLCKSKEFSTRLEVIRVITDQ